MIRYVTYEQALKESFCEKMKMAVDMQNIITIKELKSINKSKYDKLLSYFKEIMWFYGKKYVIFEDSYIDFTKARNTDNPIVSYKLKFEYYGGEIKHTKELNNDFITFDIPYSIVSAFV